MIDAIASRKMREIGPSRLMEPVLRSARPQIALRRVVFPAPFGPISPVIVPGSKTASTSHTAATAPKRTLTKLSFNRPPALCIGAASGIGRSQAARPHPAEAAQALDQPPPG